MNTIARGTVAELAVAKKLAEQNIVVSLPLSHSSSYDLIADSDGLKRVQVKRAYKVNNHGKEQFCVETRRILVKHSGKKGSIARSYEPDSFDFLVAVDVENDDYWIIPFEITTEYKAQIYLRTAKMDNYKNQWVLMGIDVSS